MSLGMLYQNFFFPHQRSRSQGTDCIVTYFQCYLCKWTRVKQAHNPKPCIHWNVNNFLECRGISKLLHSQCFHGTSGQLSILRSALLVKRRGRGLRGLSYPHLRLCFPPLDFSPLHRSSVAKVLEGDLNSLLNKVLLRDLSQGHRESLRGSCHLQELVLPGGFGRCQRWEPFPTEQAPCLGSEVGPICGSSEWAAWPGRSAYTLTSWVTGASEVLPGCTAPRFRWHLYEKTVQC